MKTAESKERTDIQAPSNCFVLVEACIPKALEEPVHLVRVAFGLADVEVGSYLHEYTRPKTDWGPGLPRNSCAARPYGIRFLFHRTLERDWPYSPKKTRPRAEEAAPTDRALPCRSPHHPRSRKELADSSSSARSASALAFAALQGPDEVMRRLAIDLRHKADQYLVKHVCVVDRTEANGGE